jgi:hypothetical protein
MRKIATLAGVAALGVAAQSQAYNATANVTFSWGNTSAGTGTTIGWTSNGPQGGITTVANSTYFTTVGGSNSVGYYNSDFATLGNTSPSTFCAAWKAYGCIEYGTFAGVTSAIGNVGPGPSASGTLTITDTTLTGTLTLNAGNDEPAGKAGLVADGFNLRGADGSPFGNSWNGFASATTTLTVNLTGSFSATSWAINGGTVRFSDSAGIG